MRTNYRHPNRRAFEGCITLVDVPSDKAPSGARGHRVILTRQAAQLALPTLIGMGVNFNTEWDGHDARSKCGVITEASIEGDRVMVSGYVYTKDFPEFLKINDSDMGMSYELHDAHVENMRKSVWTLTSATFTGAAILFKHKAAYRDTSFKLEAA
jgi:hypothetical protein